MSDYFELMNIEATAKQIMSAKHSDAFNQEACEQILRDNLQQEGGDATCQQGQEQPKTSTQIGNAAPNVQPAGAAQPKRSHAAQPQRREPSPEQMQQIHDAADEARRRVSKMSRAEKQELEDSARRRIHARPQPSKASPLGEHSECDQGEGFCIHRGATSDQPLCEICGEPMPKGEETFKYHGYSGPCPKPPVSDQPPDDKPKVFKMDAEGYGVSPSGVRLLKPEIAVKEANAELAAERQRREQVDRLWRARYNDAWQQLLSALAAIEQMDGPIREAVYLLREKKLYQEGVSLGAFWGQCKESLADLSVQAASGCVAGLSSDVP